MLLCFRLWDFFGNPARLETVFISFMRHSISNLIERCFSVFLLLALWILGYNYVTNTVLFLLRWHMWWKRKTFFRLCFSKFFLEKLIRQMLYHIVGDVSVKLFCLRASIPATEWIKFQKTSSRRTDWSGGWVNELVGWVGRKSNL